MARMTLEQITEKLTAAKAAGQIWNVEFTDVRESFGRRLEERVDRQLSQEIRTALEAAGMDRSDTFQFTGDFCCTNYTNLKGRIDRTEKALRLAGYLPHVTTQIEALRALLPLCELVKEVKGMVVKGRKPSENPSLNARTIENTGTCGCCGRNIKLSAAGRIVDHGYGIANRGYGFGAGYKTGASCFGFHYEPIEVSPKVWEDMKAAMETRLAKLPEILAGAKANFAAMAPAHRLNPLGPVLTKDQKDHNRSRQLAERAILDMTHELERLPYSIEEMTDKLAAWAPKPLPGTRSAK